MSENTTENTLVVIVNAAGGAAAAAGDGLADSLRTAFAAAGATADVRLTPGKKLLDAVRDASSARRIVVAGGDGTLAAAAQALEGSDCELALLPLGTLNHLARDLGIPRDLDAAAALAVSGTARLIDLGEVNGRRFVNNASIGLYPAMVRSREAQRDRHGWPKWLATFPAAWDALSHKRNMRLRLDMGSGTRPLATPLLFVGNNRYGLEAGRVGRRASLSEGLLSIFAVAHRSPAGLIAFGLRTLVGRSNAGTDFDALGECTALTIESAGGSVDIALDGEIRRMKFPLKFRVLPHILPVVCPAE